MLHFVTQWEVAVAALRCIPAGRGESIQTRGVIVAQVAVRVTLQGLVDGQDRTPDSIDVMKTLTNLLSKTVFFLALVVLCSIVIHVIIILFIVFEETTPDYL
jgi:hypothetical protein